MAGGTISSKQKSKTCGKAGLSGNVQVGSRKG
jgi:hypothetical protein